MLILVYLLCSAGKDIKRFDEYNFCNLSNVDLIFYYKITFDLSIYRTFPIFYLFFLKKEQFKIFHYHINIFYKKTHSLNCIYTNVKIKNKKNI
jgi:hypothetical protein